MSTPHKNSEVIKAWAEGKTVQSRRINTSRWFDFTNSNDFGPWEGDPAYEWRVKTDTVKPATVKVRYRVGIFDFDFDSSYGRHLGTIQTDAAAKEWEKSPFFIRWLTDWQEEEVEANAARPQSAGGEE